VADASKSRIEVKALLTFESGQNYMQIRCKSSLQLAACSLRCLITYLGPYSSTLLCPPFSVRQTIRHCKCRYVSQPHHRHHPWRPAGGPNFFQPCHFETPALLSQAASHPPSLKRRIPSHSQYSTCHSTHFTQDDTNCAAYDLTGYLAATHLLFHPIVTRIRCANHARAQAHVLAQQSYTNHLVPPQPESLYDF